MAVAARSDLAALAEGDPLVALRAAARLRTAAARSARVEQEVARLARRGDDTARLLAPGALTAAGGPAAERALFEALMDGSPRERREAAAALAARAPEPAALEPLCALVAAGGCGAAVALLTLEDWGRRAPDLVAPSLLRALARADSGGARARLVEAAGTVAGTELALLGVLRDPDEPAQARAHAAAALGARPGRGVVEALVRAAGGGPAVRLACGNALLSVGTARALLAARSLAAATAGSREPHDLLLRALVDRKSVV